MALLEEAHRYESLHYRMKSELLKTYFFEFTPEQLEYLSRFSKDPDITTTLETFVKYKKNVNGLFHEVRNINGSWNFKDTVLPKLFRELHSNLKEIKKLIESIHSKEGYLSISLDTTFKQSCHYNEQDNLKRRYDLFTYLIQKFHDSFIYLPHNKEQLSRVYSHATLGTRIRRLDARIMNVLRAYHDDLLYTCKERAAEGLREIIIGTLSLRFENEEGLPVLLREPDIEYMFRYHESLLKLIKKCFRPGYGNSEYQIGLEPIWSDIPGKGYYVYYFDHSPYDVIKLKGENFVLITRSRISDYTHGEGLPGASENKRLLNQFEKLEQKETFLEWFHSEHVKPTIIRHYASDLMYHYVDDPESPSEAAIQDSTDQLKSTLDLMKDYYGLTYDLREVIEHVKGKKQECIERYNISDEEKERQKEVLSKLFPLDEDLEKKTASEKEEIKKKES